MVPSFLQRPGQSWLRAVFLICGLGLLLSPTQASAQSDISAFQLQQFRPQGDPYGMFHSNSGESLGQWRYAAGIYFNYSNVPLRLLERKPGGTVEPFAELISHQVSADLVGIIGLANFLDIGLQIPLTIYQVGKMPKDDVFGPLSDQDLSGFFLNDIKFSIKFSFLAERRKNPVGLGLQLFIGIPTSAAHSPRKFSGEEPVTFGAALLFNKTINILTLAVNFGYRFNPKTEFTTLIISHELFYSLGVNLAIVNRKFDLVFDFMGALAVEKVQARSAPFDLLIGGRIYPGKTKNLAINFGFGVPFTPGYGSPLFRIFAGLIYSNVERDTDGDGLLDFEDKCPKTPGPRENVGCPWPDTDKDGLLDKDDRCPKTPGPKENKGCPWNDTDGDGLIDPKDKCPRKPGPRQNQGCPWPDTDGDGLIDPKDKCPKVPGPRANKGCPWPDTDKDGLLDKDDKCPLKPGPKSNNGCPLVIVNKKVRRIYILKKVFFDFNKASIKPVSFPVLDAVYNVLKRYPKIHVEIQGHTDNIGRKSYNQKLSERRARAVRRYLATKGISATRMTFKGYGMSKPLVGSFPRFTKEERDKNRRVEFHITRQ